jgi:hypothetical protein
VSASADEAHGVLVCRLRVTSSDGFPAPTAPKPFNDGELVAVRKPCRDQTRLRSRADCFNCHGVRPFLPRANAVGNLRAAFGSPSL